MSRNLLSKIKRKMNYLLNKLSRYDYEAHCAGWERYPTPVFGDETTASVFDPYVIQKANGYRLYVSERMNDGIICADSEDGIHWDKHRVSLERGIKGSWEEKVNRACVLKKDNKWMMWYTGQDSNNSAIGLALSEDGICFERTCNRPVLQAEERYEKNAVMNPCVVWDENRKIFRMWYAAGEQYEPDVICYAESFDGMNWKKYCNNPILGKTNERYEKYKVGGCDIINLKGKYYLFYIGYQNVDVARICIAQSLDGINNWTKCKENPIIAPEKKSWNADAVYKPTVLFNESENKIMLWYNGRKANTEKIGYAYYLVF